MTHLDITNPIHRALYQNVIEPALNNIGTHTIGRIYAIHGNDVVDIVYNDPNTGVVREWNNVELPSGDGALFNMGYEIGDLVDIGFMNGIKSNPFVSGMRKKKDRVDESTENGSFSFKNMGF